MVPCPAKSHSTKTFLTHGQGPMLASSAPISAATKVPQGQRSGGSPWDRQPPLTLERPHSRHRAAHSAHGEPPSQCLLSPRGALPLHKGPTEVNKSGLPRTAPFALPSLTAALRASNAASARFPTSMTSSRPPSSCGTHAGCGPSSGSSSTSRTPWCAPSPSLGWEAAVGSRRGSSG